MHEIDLANAFATAGLESLTLPPDHPKGLQFVVEKVLERGFTNPNAPGAPSFGPKFPEFFARMITDDFTLKIGESKINSQMVIPENMLSAVSYDISHSLKSFSGTGLFTISKETGRGLVIKSDSFGAPRREALLWNISRSADAAFRHRNISELTLIANGTSVDDLSEVIKPILDGTLYEIAGRWEGIDLTLVD